jgi:hypothetical protein
MKICETIINKIKDNKFYSPNKLNNILKKNNYEYTYNLLLDLLEYYDIINKNNEGKNNEDN